MIYRWQKQRLFRCVAADSYNKKGMVLFNETLAVNSCIKSWTFWTMAGNRNILNIVLSVLVDLFLHLICTKFPKLNFLSNIEQWLDNLPFLFFLKMNYQLRFQFFDTDIIMSHLSMITYEERSQTTLSIDRSQSLDVQAPATHVVVVRELGSYHPPTGQVRPSWLCWT